MPHIPVRWFLRISVEYRGRGYKFLRNGRRVWVMWSLDGNPHSVIFAPGSPVAAWDAMGVTVTPATSMNITIKPVYLEWNP